MSLMGLLWRDFASCTLSFFFFPIVGGVVFGHFFLFSLFSGLRNDTQERLLAGSILACPLHLCTLR